MNDILKFTSRGIYCAPGDFYIDPWRPVQKALITHAHADHARPNHKAYLAQESSFNVLKYRLGEQSKIETIPYAKPIKIGPVEVSFHPAGHIPGSSQIKINYKGKIAVVSGDYKLEDDGLCTPFEPIKCHQFVTESTFGLPVYNWPDQSDVYADINQWWLKNKAHDKTSIIFAYSLGKAQRILKNIDVSIGKVFTHGAVENMNEALSQDGYQLPETKKVSNELNKHDFKGNLIIAPPSAMGSTWMRKLGPLSTGIASGWMTLRGTRRRKAADRGFVLSDHADWKGLLQAVKATEAEEVFVTHGYSSIFSKFLNEQGINAQEVDTLFEGEKSDSADD